GYLQPPTPLRNHPRPAEPRWALSISARAGFSPRRSHNNLAHCRHTISSHERPVRFLPPTRTATLILLSSPESPLLRQYTWPPASLGRRIPRPRKTGRPAFVQPDETVS